MSSAEQGKLEPNIFFGANPFILSDSISLAVRQNKLSVESEVSASAKETVLLDNLQESLVVSE